MKILIAEDERIPRTILERTLRDWGHEVLATSDGLAAWQELERDDAPQLAVLDWIMPGLDGIEVCQKARTLHRDIPTYIILLTGMGTKENVVTGLESGANDYVTKPFDHQELRARIRVGCQVIELQRRLAERVRDLEAALVQVKQLQGLLPICCYCKKIRDDRNYWHQIDSYLTEHADVRFSHGICQHCLDDVMQKELAG